SRSDPHRDLHSFPTRRSSDLVLGDWNDDLYTSIVPAHDSPYQNFVSDSAHYWFVTKTLTDQHLGSTTSHPSMIDHHLVTRAVKRSEEHTSELQSRGHLVCRLL